MIILIIMSIIVGLIGRNIPQYYILGLLFIYTWEQIYKKNINSLPVPICHPQNMSNRGEKTLNSFQY